LEVVEIPESAKLILLVGPNGSGKSSLLEAFNHWYRYKGFSTTGDKDYLEKKGTAATSNYWYDEKVKVYFYGFEDIKKDDIKDKFYFRTAYRNEPDFKITSLANQSDPTLNPKLSKLNVTDITVSENYQRLISQTLEGVFDEANNTKSILDFRTEIVGKIKQSLNNVFDDLNLSSIGDPLSDGSFYFEKGVSKDFNYENLSAGEKSVFDILLDLIIKIKYFPKAIYCIDEPEAHMHTRLQARLLKEMFRLVPEDSQLWISTHSIGMLNEAEEIEKESEASVIFLDFDNRDFDSKEVMKPTRINKSIWSKFYELALADFAKLIAPKTIVFCEGSDKGRKFKNFDSLIYSLIFENRYPSTKFVSVGSCNEIEDFENNHLKIISSVLKSSQIIKLVDRDSRSDVEVQELKEKGIKTLKLRHIESYLLDDEILKKLCQVTSSDDKYDECILIKERVMNLSVLRGNPIDDIKSASGEIIVELKKILPLSRSGNNTSSFLKDTIAPLITEETEVFRQLEREIFGE
jgi:predicted ATPase